VTESAARVRRDAPEWENVVARLVAERGDALTRYAFYVSGNREDAADLVQDALVKTFGRLRNGFTIESAEGYVRRAILTTQVDRGRRGQRWRRIAHLTATPETRDSTTDGTDLALDLHEELRKLSPRERACLVLRYYEDLKVDDIAATLELSSGTVKRYLSDGLAKMARSLSPATPADANASVTAIDSGVHRAR
jgi:RNA polymerase sigma factor (sigma-70 family)